MQEEKDTMIPEQQTAPGTEEEKKKRKGPGRLGAFLGGILCGGLVAAAAFVLSTGFVDIPFLGSFVLGTNPEESVKTASPSSAGKADLNYGYLNLKLRLIEGILDREAYYPLDGDAIEDGIFTGMLYGLTEQDPYAAYYPASSFAEELNSNRGNYYGIGALMSQNRETNVITVEEVYEDSPAEEAGLLAGDILKRVNREDVTGMDLSTIVDDYVKGEEGTYVNLTVEREGSTLELQIRRGKVVVPSVYPSMLEPEETGGKKTGYIYVSGFDMATVGQFREAVDELTAAGAEGLVVDLRDNLGGIMDSALEMLDYLLPDDIGTYSQNEIDGENSGKTLVLYTENNRGRNFAYYAGDGHSLELPVAVLINQSSASASEIFAAVMKDYQRALIVGMTSYGKGVVQTEQPLPDGSAVKYTSAQYFAPSGYAVQGQGVKPDIEVEVDEAFLEAGADARDPSPEVDNQLAAALKGLYGEE